MRLFLTPSLKVVFCHSMADYYDSEDLAKFGDIGRENKELADRFFEYYNKVFEQGSLTPREKSLIALAVSHALKCPYCIDAYTQTCLEKGADEKQMNEAVHVAAAMSAGVTLVHSVQMMNKVDALSI